MLCEKQTCRNGRKNFTDVDKIIFLQLVDKVENVIENKETHTAANEMKNDAWQCIVDEFNAKTDNEPRNAKQLKTLYDNLKRYLRRHKEASAEPQEMNVTSLPDVSVLKLAKPIVNDQLMGGIARQLLTLLYQKYNVNTTNCNNIETITSKSESEDDRLIIDEDNSVDNSNVIEKNSIIHYPIVNEHLVTDNNSTPPINYKITIEDNIRNNPTIIDIPAYVNPETLIEEFNDPPTPNYAKRKEKMKYKAKKKALKNKLLEKKIQLVEFELKSKRILHCMDVRLKKLQMAKLRNE